MRTVESELLAFHMRVDDVLAFFRKVHEHVAFQAPHDEVPDELLQTVHGLFLPVDDRLLVAFPEAAVRAEQARHE